MWKRKLLITLLAVSFASILTGGAFDCDHNNGNPDCEVFCF